MSSKTAWLCLISAEIVLSVIVGVCLMRGWYGLGEPPAPYRPSLSTLDRVPDDCGQHLSAGVQDGVAV